jgi:predicted PurR-regulated permease PerM
MVTSLPYVVIYVSFLAMALYFISIHYENIRSYLPGGKRRRQDSNTTQLTNSALRSLMGYLKVQGTFAAMVLIVSMVALNIMKFKYASALAIIAGLMELIPMIGSGLMYIVMGAAYFLTGNTLAGVQVLVLTGALQLLRRLLEPKLMSNSIGISPLMSLIGMFVGMRIGGIIGLIGGPVAMSVLVGAVRGDVFKSINDDLYLVVQWFKRRWAREVPAGALIQGTPAEVKEETPPETGVPEENIAEAPAEENAAAEESAPESGGQEPSGE